LNRGVTENNLKIDLLVIDMDNENVRLKELFNKYDRIADKVALPGLHLTLAICGAGFSYDLGYFEGAFISFVAAGIVFLEVNHEHGRSLEGSLSEVPKEFNLESSLKEYTAMAVVALSVGYTSGNYLS